MGDVASTVRSTASTGPAFSNSLYCIHKVVEACSQRTTTWREGGNKRRLENGIWIDVQMSSSSPKYGTEDERRAKLPFDRSECIL